VIGASVKVEGHSMDRVEGKDAGSKDRNGGPGINGMSEVSKHPSGDRRLRM
jgi:hypothetical protein